MDYTIDLRALARVLRMGGPGLLGRLIDTALANLETRRAELALALGGDTGGGDTGGGDAGGAERAAHSIKSSARNLGATALAVAAEAAEELARHQQPGWQEAARILLSAELGVLRAELEKARLEATLPQILLVEDNPDNRLLVAVLLEERYRVVEAASAEEALVLLPMFRPDLFLIDISLPGMDGIALLAEIRRLEEHAGRPAIALTAHAMTGDRERFLAQGFDDYISKPIQQEKVLLDVIAGALRRAESASGAGTPGVIISAGSVDRDETG